MIFKTLFLWALFACTLFAGTTADSIFSVKGKFLYTNEDGDYWYFCIGTSNSDTLCFIYNSEYVLKRKNSFQNNTVVVKYKNKKFEEAPTGKLFTEKYLVSVAVDSVPIVKKKIKSTSK